MHRYFFLFLFIYSASIKAVVISVAKVSNLVIGNVVQGDLARAIPPSTVENAQNASFLVRGNANAVYTIILPTTANLTRAGATNLTLTNFLSFPAAGPNGLLSATGRQKFFVGATINAIPTNQVAGNYTGTFTVNVLY